MSPPDPALHALLGARAQGDVVRKCYVPDKINPVLQLSNGDLFGVKLKAQPLFQKSSDGPNKLLQKLCLIGEDDKVVAVPQVVLLAEVMLHESIELMKVDVGEKLRGYVA